MRTRALLLDVGGTLLSPAEPVGGVYARLARDVGLERDPVAVQAAFRAALRSAVGGQLGDGRRFWRQVVAQSLGVDHPPLVEALYTWYQTAPAWTVAPGAADTLRDLRREGLRLAVVSNWDTRLPGTLAALGLREAVDVVLVSGALGVEKPHPALFQVACALLGVLPAEAVHLGDDPRLDVQGARSAGCRALRWGEDLHSFSALSPERLAAAR